MAEKQTAQRAPRASARDPEQLETLNFKVAASFKKAFKGYAVAQGMSMVDLLREGFELSKTRRGG